MLELFESILAHLQTHYRGFLICRDKDKYLVRWVEFESLEAAKAHIDRLILINFHGRTH